MGVENLYRALQQIQGSSGPALGSADVFTAARADESIASQTVALFFELLGQFTGDLVLTMGAYNGAYIAGGVAQRHVDLLEQSHFRRGFENKGRHSGILCEVPTAVITHNIPGLLGAAACAQQRFR